MGFIDSSLLILVGRDINNHMKIEHFLQGNAEEGQIIINLNYCCLIGLHIPDWFCSSFFGFILQTSETEDADKLKWQNK